MIDFIIIGQGLCCNSTSSKPLANVSDPCIGQLGVGTSFAARNALRVGMHSMFVAASDFFRVKSRSTSISTSLATFRNHIRVIILSRTFEEVSRIAARTVVTLMADLKLKWIIMSLDHVSDAMRFQCPRFALTKYFELTIAALSYDATPRPAVIRTAFINEGEKSIKLFDCQYRYRSAGHDRPASYISQRTEETI